MATTMFYEATVKDKEGDATLDIEFGRSSYYGENLFYLNVDGKTVIMSEKDGREFCKQVEATAHYLNYQT